MNVDSPRSIKCMHKLKFDRDKILMKPEVEILKLYKNEENPE